MLNKIQLHATIRTYLIFPLRRKRGYTTAEELNYKKENVTGGRCYYAGLYFL